MKIHLVDGTYELFRAHFGAPPKKSPGGEEVGATLGLIRSMMLLLSDPEVTHVAVAFDHVIESFRNKLYPAYKSSEGVDPVILNQFALAEKMVSALGLVTWPMVKFEADDAIATAVERFKKIKSVEQIVICSVDKDLTQMVDGDKSSVGIAAARSSWTKKAWSKSSASVPSPFPIILPSSVTQRMVTQGFKVGERNPQPRCWRSSNTSSPFPKTRRNSRWDWGVRQLWLKIYRRTIKMPCCFGSYPRFGLMSR